MHDLDVSVVPPAPELDAALGKFVGDTAHFLDRPTDQWRRLRVAWLFGGGD